MSSVSLTLKLETAGFSVALFFQLFILQISCRFPLTASRDWNSEIDRTFYSGLGQVPWSFINQPLWKATQPKFVCLKSIIEAFFCINPFVPNASFLYILKTSKNRKVFWRFQRIENGCIGNKWININTLNETHHRHPTKA